MSNFALTGVLAPVFGVIAVGWLTSRLLPKSKEWIEPLNGYAYYVALPSLVIQSLWSATLSPFTLRTLTLNALTILASMMALYSLASALGVRGTTRSIFTVAGVFGNVAYLGYPLSLSKYGTLGLSVAITNSMVYNLIVFTLGIWLLRRDTNIPLRRSLADPLLLSTLIGVLLSALGLPKVAALEPLLRALSSSALPVALFALGLFMGSRGFKGNRLGLVFALTGIKFILLPSLLITFNTFLRVSGVEFAVSLIQAMAPLAVSNFVLASRYALDVEVIADSIILSTSLSFILYWLLLSSVG